MIDARPPAVVFHRIDLKCGVETGADGEMPFRFETVAPQASAFATACAIDGFSATMRTFMPASSARH